MKRGIDGDEVWSGQRESTFTIAEQDGHGWNWIAVCEGDIGKTIAVEVSHHGRTNRGNPALRYYDGSSESAFTIAEEDLQLWTGDSKDVKMAVAIVISQ